MRARLSRKCLDCECNHGEIRHSLAEFFIALFVQYTLFREAPREQVDHGKQDAGK